MAAAAKKAVSRPDTEDRPAKSDFRVTAPLVAVKDAEGNIVHLFRGDIVPEGIDQGSLDHLIDLEYISK